MQKIVTFLWYNNDAEEAARHYVSIFKNSKILSVTHYSEAASKASGQPKGSVMTVEFQLEGQKFIALNGGPHCKLTEAISLMVYCKNQAEIDSMWKKLSAGGAEIQCGWLKDKFGLCWQIVPAELMKILTGRDVAKSEAAHAVVMRSRKLNLAEIKKAVAAIPKKSKAKKKK